MLSKDKRLNLKKDFKWVASGQKIESPLFKLFIKEGSNTKARVGIAVSGQVFKKASERNRSRRLISKGFEVLYTKLPENINIIALPKVRVVEVKSNDVAKELEKILTGEKIIS